MQRGVGRDWLRYRPVASLLITGRRSFSVDFGPFQGLKTEVHSGCLGEPRFFKIITTDDVTLWSKLESIRLVSLLDFINSIS